MTGYFYSPSITFGTTTLTNAGAKGDIFFVKYDASGNVLWAKSEGGTLNDGGGSVVTDAGSNVMVTGWFDSPSITFGATTLTKAGQTDIFIVKYDASGNVLWAKSAGGTGNDQGLSVATDAGGNVFVTGWFDSPSITFGTITLTKATTNNRSDIFIVKYDASGNVLWAKSAGGTGYNGGGSVATDAGGNVFVTGRFESPSITFGTTTLTSVGGAGAYDMFVARLGGGITAVAELAHGASINFYPNPVSKELIIRNENLNIEGVEMMDAMGKTIFKSSITHPKSEISFDVSSLATGIYFVAVLDERGNKMVRKFVKQ